MKKTRAHITFYEDNPTYKDTAETAWPVGANVDLSEATRALEALPQALSFLVVRKGKLVFEKYFNGSGPRDSNNIHSSSKTILAGLVGIALREGFLPDLDTKIPKLLSGYSIRGARKNITLRHLLTMTAGLRWTEDETEYAIEDADDWVQAILDLPLDSSPGEKFKYSSGLTHLLSAILTRSSGMSTRAFANRFFFSPLGIGAEHWGRDPQGIYSGGYNLYLTPREMARVGQLYLQNGIWAGKEVLPADWIRETLRTQVTVDRTRSYGYLCWLPTRLGEPVQKMWGFGGQFVYLLPEKDTVVVLTADTKQEHEEMDGDAFLARYVLPRL